MKGPLLEVAWHLFGTKPLAWTCYDLVPKPNGHFTDGIFKLISFKENACVLIQISLNCILWGPFVNKAASVWCLLGAMPLPEQILSGWSPVSFTIKGSLNHAVLVRAWISNYNQIILSDVIIHLSPGCNSDVTKVLLNSLTPGRFEWNFLYK